MNKHTKGPSYLRNKGAEIWRGDTIIALAVGDESASYEIIRRYNYHDELLEACKLALPQLEWANIHGSRGEEILTQVKAAIAAAQRKES